MTVINISTYHSPTFAAIMELLLASNNSGKIAEIRQLLPGYSILGLNDIGFTQTIEEPFFTFRENAWVKANTLWDFCGKPVLADDSGICVDELSGAPGVFSARFSGSGATDARNNECLLDAMKGISNRKAHYTAVLCLMIEGQAHYFEGICEGSIALQPAGSGGFGYDPLFIPDGYSNTFGELDVSIKKSLSHRAQALQKLLASGLLAIS